MRGLSLTLIYLALSAIPYGGPAIGQDVDPTTKMPTFSQMTQKAEEQGHIRVIVQLDVPDIKTLGAVSADGSLAARITAKAEDLLSRTGSGGITVRHRYSAFPLLALDLSPGMLPVLAQAPEVLKITEDYLFRPVLNDTVNIIGASGSWDSGYTGSDWYVAILDTGIRSSHDFFNGKTIVEACYSAESHCPNNASAMTGTGAAAHHPDTYFGWDHGTHVAGIAGGRNDPTLNGVAKDAGIIAVQVFSRFDAPSECGVNNPCVLAYNSDIIAGLNHIYSLRTFYNIAAVNLSLGGGYYAANCDGSYSSFKVAIDQLRAAGIATVVASGNEGYCDGIAAPGCISSAIAVGATTDADVMTSFSNYHEDLVDIFAPGSSIYSAVGDSDSSYEFWGGTSMAAPHVSGAFALLRQANPSATVTELLTAIKDSSGTVEDSVHCEDSGTLPVARINIEDTLNPSAPDGLTALAMNSDEIALNWNDNADSEQGFKIDRKTGAGGTYTEIATVAANTTDYNDNSALTEGTLYYYRVRSYYGASYSSYSNEATTSTLLAGPSALAAAVLSDTDIDLSWTDNSSAESGFEVDRRTGDGSFSRIGTLGADSTEFSDTELAAGTTYDYRIRSTNGTISSLYTQTSARTTGGGGGGSSGGCFLSTITR